MPIFYTMRATNITGTIQPLVFDVKLQRPLFEDPSKWSVGVVRFNIPNYSTPFLTFEDGAYTVMLSYKGFYSIADVIYIPQNDIPDSRAVFQIQELVVMINTAIQTAFTNLNAQISLASSHVPYFTYDEVTQLYSLVADSTFITSNTDPVVLAINEQLNQLITGFPCYYSTSTGTVVLLVQFLNNNMSTVGSATFYTMTQQAPSFGLASTFEGLLFTTDMPIKNEYVGTSYANLETPDNVQLQNQFQNQSSQPILQDFTANDLNVNTFLNNIIYNAIVPYRQCDLISNSPFYNISITVYVLNVDGSRVLTRLPPRASANIKLMFTEKSNNNFA